MKIPAQTEEIFRAHAVAGVAAFREALSRTDLSTGAFCKAFDEVLLPSLKQEFYCLARQEFERIGKDHVRQIVLGVFDKFMEGQ